MEATGYGIASVVSAGVAVIAIGFGAAHAEALSTLVVQSADVAIAASSTLVGGDPGTLAILGVAKGLQAGSIRSCRFLALDCSIGSHGTLMGECADVTFQGAVAEVSIFQRPTIGVLHAVAIHFNADAIAQ
jgi:hypothetical protein